MAPHPNLTASALKMNQKRGAKRSHGRLANAAREDLRVKDPVTGNTLGWRTPLEVRADVRISLSFTFFAGFGGSALGSEACGSICGGIFDTNADALEVLEGNLAPPPSTEKGTLVRAFETFDLLPGLARPGTAVRTMVDASIITKETQLKTTRDLVNDLRARADAELNKVHGEKKRNGIIEAEAEDSTRPTTEAGRALRALKNAEKTLNKLLSAPRSTGRTGTTSPGNSSSASNISSTPIDNCDEVATRICNAILGVLKSLGLKSEFQSANIDGRGINVKLADDFDVYLQFSPPCQEASNNNPNGDREYTIKVLRFLVDVEALIRTKIPITGSWYEMVNGHVIREWMEKGQTRPPVEDRENGHEEELLVDLQAVMLSSQDGCSTAQRRERILWVSGNRRRGVSAERVKRDLRHLAILGRVVPVSTVLGLDPEYYEYVDNRRPGPEKKEKRKPLDNLQGFTMTSNPPSIGKIGTSEGIQQLSTAQVLALQGFDPRVYYVPKAMTQAHLLVGCANMVPLQLSIIVWRALMYGVQVMVYPGTDGGTDDPFSNVFINCSRYTQAQKNEMSRETKTIMTQAENLGTKQVRGDQQRVWYDGQEPEKPPMGQSWRQIPLDPYVLMKAEDKLNPVNVGCDARTPEGTVVPGGYFCRLRSARAEDTCLPEDLPCLSGWCVDRATKFCGEEGVYFCDHHFDKARDDMNRDWRLGIGKKLEHQHCTLCGGEEEFQERAPGLSNFMNEYRNREMAVTDMHSCSDEKCHRSICMTCLFTRWVNATCLRSDRSGFLCHVHDRGEEFAAKSDDLRQKRTARLDRREERNRSKLLAACPPRVTRSTNQVKQLKDE